MQETRTCSALTLAGTLPFLGCAIAPLFGYASVPLLGPLDAVVASYGLAIVCFLAGTHWGLYLAGSSAGVLNLFVLSNTVFLAVWIAYIAASIEVAIGVQVLAFLALLPVEFKLRKGDVISRSYLRIRGIATLIAVASLIVVLAR